MSAKGVSSFIRRNRAAIGGMTVLGAAMAASLYVQGPNSPELTLSDLANLDGGRTATVERAGTVQATAVGTEAGIVNGHGPGSGVRP